jgi:hypothetical protein
VRLDYDNLMLEVYSPGSINIPRGGYLLKPNFSTLPLQMATLNDDRADHQPLYF